jgi:hypothetical protein
VEPKLGIVEQVERCECHLLAVQCLAHMEEPFAVIQPWQVVISAVEFGKFHLVGRRVGVVAGVPCFIVCRAAPGARGRVMTAWCALHHFDPVNGVLQFLLMAIVVSHHSFQRLDARLEQLQRLQLQLNGIQVVHDGIECSLDGVPQTGGQL